MITRRPRGNTRPAPLLFVHGAWHGAWCWDQHFLNYFAEHGYHVAAVSVRGHGRSPGRDRLRAARIAHYVQDVAQAARRLPAAPVVIGHSMGGLVVQKYLEAHPAAAGVLLASVPPGGVIGATLRIARRHPWQFLECNLKLSMYPLVSTPQLCREAFFSPRLPAEAAAGYCELIQDESYFAFLDMLAFNLPRPRRVKVPMLVLGGTADNIFSVPEVKATARAYGTEAAIFPGMAHDMMLEPGWEQVAEHIRGWLGRQGL